MASGGGENIESELCFALLATVLNRGYEMSTDIISQPLLERRALFRKRKKAI